MSLDHVFTLANDSEFRTLVAFSGPPRAGRVLERLPNGQLRIEMDDPDGGDVRAWPLNGAAYSPDQIVYCLFAANSPDSAIILGAKGSTPTIAPLLRAQQVHVGPADTTPNVLLTVGDDLGAYPGSNRISVGNATGPAAINLGTDSQNRVFLFWNPTNKLFAFGTRVDGTNYNAFTVDKEKVLINAPGGATPEATLDVRGSVYAHDGMGGLRFWSHPGVGATPAVIVREGAGAVAHQCLVWAVARSGAGAGSFQAALSPGQSYDYAASDGTWRVRVTAAGQLEVLRTQGTATAKVTVLALWS